MLPSTSSGQALRVSTLEKVSMRCLRMERMVSISSWRGGSFDKLRTGSSSILIGGVLPGPDPRRSPAGVRGKLGTGLSSG